VPDRRHGAGARPTNLGRSAGAMSVTSGAGSRGADSNSVLDTATIPDYLSSDDPKYAVLNELLQQREQDLLAAADIGEMLLEKNRALNQQVADLQARLLNSARHSRGSEGLTLSSEGDDDDSDDDDSSEDERLNTDGSVVLTGRKARVSLLHETQMTQRRTSFKGQALREAQERQQELERVTRENERAEETIALLLANDVMLRTLLQWRKLTDVSLASRLHRQNAELQEGVDSLQRQTETANAAAADAEQRAEAVQDAATAAAADAAQAAAVAKETIATLQLDLERSQTTKIQQKDDYETQIAALNQSLKHGEQAHDKHVAEAVSLQRELQASQALLENAQQQLNASQLLLQHLQEDKEKLQTQFDQTHAEKRALAAAVEEYKSRILSFTDVENAHDREKEANAQLQAELTRMQTEHETALQELRSQNSVLKGLMEDAKIDSESKVLQVSSAKDQELSDLRSKLQHTRDEQQQMKLAMQETRKMLEQVEAEYQEKVKSLAADNETLKESSLQQIAALREGKKSEVQSLSEQLSSLQVKMEAVIQDATDSKKAAQELVQTLEEKLRLSDRSRQDVVASNKDKERQVNLFQEQMTLNATQLAALQQELLSEQEALHILRQDLAAGEKQQRRLEDQIRELKKEVEDAGGKNMQMKVLFTEKLRKLRQDVKRGLLAIHERSYRTETFVADIEVEVARYTTNMTNTHHLELAALERQMLAAKSQAQLVEHKLSVEAMKQEEDLKIQVQVLTANMAQKEDMLKSLRDDKSVTLARSQQSLDLLQIEVTKKTAAVKSLEDELKKQEAIGRELQHKLNATEARQRMDTDVMMELKSTVESLEDKLKREEAAGRELQNKLKTSEAHHNTALMELKSTVESLEDMLKKQEAAGNLLQIEVTNKTAAVKSLEDELKKHEAAGRELQHKLNATEARQRMDTDVMMELKSTVESLEDKLKREEAAGRELQNKLKTSEAHHNTALMELKSTVESLEDMMNKQEAAGNLLQIEVTKKTAAVKSLEDELKKHEAAGRELQHKLNATEAKEKDTLAEKDVLAQEAVENMMILEGEIKNLKAQVQNLTAMLQYDKHCLMELKEAKQTAVVLSVSLLQLLAFLFVTRTSRDERHTYLHAFCFQYHSPQTS
jgi:chromosome segregation ATPase